jgi:hypothetical protein
VQTLVAALDDIKTTNMLIAPKDNFDLALARTCDYSLSCLLWFSHGSNHISDQPNPAAIPRLYHRKHGKVLLQSAVVLFETVAVTLFRQSRPIYLSLPSCTIECRYDSTAPTYLTHPAAPQHRCRGLTTSLIFFWLLSLQEASWTSSIRARP